MYINLSLALQKWSCCTSTFKKRMCTLYWVYIQHQVKK